MIKQRLTAALLVCSFLVGACSNVGAPPQPGVPDIQMQNGLLRENHGEQDGVTRTTAWHFDVGVACVESYGHSRDGAVNCQPIDTLSENAQAHADALRNLYLRQLQASGEPEVTGGHGILREKFGGFGNTTVSRTYYTGSEQLCFEILLNSTAASDCLLLDELPEQGQEHVRRLLTNAREAGIISR